MKFGFIAKHRGIWPTDWLCGALGVSRGGFYARLTRPRSQRSRSVQELGAYVHSSFLASDRASFIQGAIVPVDGGRTAV